MAAVYRVFTEKLGGSDAATFVGNQGELFWDPTTTALKMSDGCLLYTSPSPRDQRGSRMPSSA